MVILGLILPLPTTAAWIVDESQVIVFPALGKDSGIPTNPSSSLETKWQGVWDAAVELRVTMAAARASFLSSPSCSDTGSCFYGNRASAGPKKKRPVHVLTRGELTKLRGMWKATLPYAQEKGIPVHGVRREECLSELCLELAFLSVICEQFQASRENCH